MKKIFTTLLIFTFAVSAYSQQYPLFSHYVLNCFGYNPAVAGLTDRGEIKLTYRTQWVDLEEAPETRIATGQGKIKNTSIGIGGYMYKDTGGKLERQGGNLALAYGLKLSENAILSVGLSGGLYQMNLDRDFNVTNEDDPRLADATGGMWFTDFSGGVMLKTGKAYVGLSVPQIFEPNFNFENVAETGAKNELARHYYLMGGYRMPVKPNIIEFEPSALIKVVDKTPVQFEVTGRVLLKNMFWVGASYRSDKTAAFLAGIEWKDFEIGYAFDAATSDLRRVSSGTHEITLGVRFGKGKDRDGDGIPDHKDKCPDEPGTEENDGCPEEEAIADNEEEEEETDGMEDDDHDGIRNDVDKCPRIPGTASNGGCPIDDRDRDGIVDHMDKCPDIPGALVTEGCPAEDTDEDGLVDALDKCPTEPGPAYTKGCPIEGASGEVNPLVKNLMANIPIRNVYFDTDKDFIRKQYFSDLNQLAKFLVENKEIKVSLSGHADERNSLEYNIDLSKRRVESVLFYLLNRDVNREQLIAEYYGETRPADVRKGEASFQLNRRVELQFVIE